MGALVHEEGEVRTERLKIQPVEREEFGFGEVVDAAFRTENSLGSYLSHGPSREIELEETDQEFDDYNPLDDVPEKHLGMIDSYIGLLNPEQVESMTVRLESEMKDREMLAASGWKGVVSTIAAGTLDPIMLPLLFIPGANVVATGAKATRAAGQLAAAGATGIGVSEVALHKTQEVRTGLESAFNIGGAALLSGILGAAVAKFSKGEFDTLAKSVEREFAEEGEFGGRSVGAAAIDTTTLKEEELVGALGLEKALSGATPLLRMSTAPVNASRRLVQSLAESALYTNKNLEGKASTVAVETLIKAYDARLGHSFEKMDSMYVKYRTGAEGGLSKRVGTGIADIFGARRRSGKLSYKQFREQVGRAMRRGDKHEIPEVSAVAQTIRKSVLDPAKNDAIELGLLPEGVTARGALSYLTRVYNTEKIKARPVEFKGILNKWVDGEVTRSNMAKVTAATAKARDAAEKAGKSIAEVDAAVAKAEAQALKEADALSQAEIQDISDEITKNILGENAGRVPLDIVPKAGPLKERVLTIEDDLIEDFLESDVEMIAQYYNRTDSQIWQ